jgi:hypothetical protein
MDGTKYIGMDVHKEATTIAVLDPSGKLVMESIVETKAVTIVQLVQGLRINGLSLLVGKQLDAY